MKTKTSFVRRTLLLSSYMILITVSKAQITEEWVARYNGPDNGVDVTNSLVVDDSGYIYVTGCSGGNNQDYATIK